MITSNHQRDLLSPITKLCPLASCPHTSSNGHPISVLDYILNEEILPNNQPKPHLAQLVTTDTVNHPHIWKISPENFQL